MLTNETSTAKYLCQTALDQSSATTEEEIQAHNELSELKMSYEEIRERDCK